MFAYNYRYAQIYSLAPVTSRGYSFLPSNFLSFATFDFKPVKYPAKMQLRDTSAQIKGQMRPYAEANGMDFI